MPDQFQTGSVTGEGLDQELVAESVQPLEELGYNSTNTRTAVEQVGQKYPDIDDPGNLVKRALQEVIS